MMPHPPSLNPLSSTFYLWGYQKEKALEDNAQTIEDKTEIPAKSRAFTRRDLP